MQRLYLYPLYVSCNDASQIEKQFRLLIQASFRYTKLILFRFFRMKNKNIC